jgi:hypothetical protein
MQPASPFPLYQDGAVAVIGAFSHRQQRLEAFRSQGHRLVDAALASLSVSLAWERGIAAARAGRRDRSSDN